MANPIDYMLGAAMYRFAREGNKFDFPDDIEGLQANLASYYETGIDIEIVEAAARRAASMGFITYIDDMYAGKIISANVATIDSKYDDARDQDPEIFREIEENPFVFYQRVLKNPNFWRDASFALQNEAGGLAEISVPASDRSVTILHNSESGRAIEETLDKIIVDLELSNEVAETAGSDRPRLLAEAKASRELVKGESIRRSAIMELVWKFFREVAKKFREKSLDWGVDHVLKVLDDMLDLLK